MLTPFFDDDFFGLTKHNNRSPLQTMLKMDMKETPTEFQAIVDVPGIEKDDIKITFENGVLGVSAHREQEKKGEDGRWHWNERSSGTVSRRIALPENVDENRITAKTENGVLRITIPKLKKDKENPKYIKIN